MYNSDFSKKGEQRDTVKPYKFESVEGFFKWLKSKSGCNLIDSINEKYTHEYIFNCWRNNENFISNPILISQYSKALIEYSKFGKLMYFPEKEIYKMLRIIVQNSIVIAKLSSMFARIDFLPETFLNNTLLPFYSELVGEKVTVLPTEKFTFVYEMSIDKAEKTFNIKIDKDYKHSIHIHYDGIADDDGVFNFLNAIIRNFRWFPNGKLIVTEDNTVTVHENVIAFLQKTDFHNKFLEYKTEELGLSYMFYYLKQLRDDFTPEEALVWINQMVHIYHFRDDISRHFIEGGSGALDKVENGLKE
jgi:hypothetical protein